jgi:O-antigen/teichoic acid export membrane protein
MNLFNKIVIKFKEFIKTSFVKDVGFLQISNFFSIFVSTIGSIILARLLRPEMYGTYGIIFAFVGTVGIFMNWGADYAGLTLLAEAYAIQDKEKIINILTYYIKLTFFVILIIGSLGIIFSPFITKLLYHDAQIGNWGRIVLAGVCLGAAYNLLNVILQASRKIKFLVVLEILNKLIFTLLPIIFVLLGLGLSGVVWGYFISAITFLCASLLILYFLSRNGQLLISFKDVFRNFRKVNFKKYFKFGFLIAINKNLGSLLSLLPILALGIYAASSDVAYFKIAIGYIGIPLMVLDPITKLLGVQLPKSKTYGIDTLKKHFYRTSLWSGLISLGLILPFIVFGPFLIRIFYGAEYGGSIGLIYWLSLFGVISGFSVGLGPIYRTLDKMKIAIMTIIAEVILMMLLITILVKVFPPLLSVALSLTLSSTIFLFIHFYILGRIFKKNAYRE